MSRRKLTRNRVRLRRRYAAQRGGVRYQTRPLQYYEALADIRTPAQRASFVRAFAARRAANNDRARRISRYTRNAPAYRRMSTAAGIRSIVGGYANRVRGRLLARRVAKRLGRRSGVGNYIQSFL